MITYSSICADWSSASLKGREREYTYQWTAADTAEVDAAVNRLQPTSFSEDDVLKISKGQLHHSVATCTKSKFLDDTLMVVSY